MDKKKKILIIGGIGWLVLVGFLIWVKFKRQPAQQVIPTKSSGLTATPTPELLNYKDEAGFEFEHPKGLMIKDVSGNQDVYSILEISYQGELMTIKVIDTKYKSVDDWLKKAPEATGAGLGRDIELSGMVGQQLQLENPRRLATAVIDQGVLYYFESPLDESGFWNKAHNAIVTSFKVTAFENGGTSQTGSSAGAGDNIIYEEEEIVE